MPTSQAQFVLSPAYTYRREWFGGLLFHHASKQTRFFNHMAAMAIESLLPKDATPLPDLSAGQLSFVDGLIAEGIAVAGHPSVPAARSFFRDVFDFDADRFRAPLAVELELTLKCMRRCTYCAYDARPDAGTSRDMSRESYQGIFSKLRETGVLYLRFTGGDPLTRDDCLEILEDADRFALGIAIATDLTVFSEETATRLSKLRNLVAVQTTLDGPNPAIADEQRGNGNFRRVTTGLELLAAKGVPVIVGTIVGKHNLPYVYETARYLSRWPVAWCVSPLYAAGRGRETMALVPDDADMAVAYEQFARAINEGLVRPADPAWNEIAAPLNSTARSHLWHGLPWLVRSPDRVMRVDPGGRCYTSIHLKEVLADDVYVGSIIDDDVGALWNNAPLLNELRSQRERSNYFGDVFDIRTFRKGGKTENAPAQSGGHQ